MTVKVVRIVRNLLGLLFVMSAITLVIICIRYQRMQSHNNRLNQLVISMPREKLSSNTSDVSESGLENGLPIVDFNALKSINENCVGWIYACNGEISYPIVASCDDYYLSHSVDGKQSKAGAILVDSDSENPFVDNSAVIYGHNMKDGSMFHPLLQYWQKNDYALENPYIYILTENNSYIYEITSVYVDEYENIKSISNKPQNTQNMIYLITCEYSGEDTRLVVEARIYGVYK